MMAAGLQGLPITEVRRDGGAEEVPASCLAAIHIRSQPQGYRNVMWAAQASCTGVWEYDVIQVQAGRH